MVQPTRANAASDRGAPLPRALRFPHRCVPLEEQAPIASNGFLDSGKPWGFPPETAKPLAVESFANQRVVVWVGDAGLGKTELLRRFVAPAGGRSGLLVEARDLIGPGARDRVRLAVDALPVNGRLAIDHLEQTSSSAVALIHRLRDHLGSNFLRTGRLRLACRTSYWSGAAGDALAGLFPDAPQVLELLPLDEDDVRAAAAACGVEHADFLRAVLERSLGPLAARPLTLGLLLRTAEGPALPASRAQLFERALDVLVGARLAAEGARRALGLLALMTLVTNRRTIRRGSPRPPAELGTDELGLTSCRVLDDMLQTVGLFRRTREDAFEWTHPSFVEALAADWLASLDDPDAHQRIVQLFEHPAGGLVPQLAGLAGWIDERFPSSLRARLTDLDPVARLCGDPMSLPSDERPHLVDALLRGLAAGRCAGVSAAAEHYARLRHPNLGEQLRPWLLGRSVDPVARRAAFAMARAAEVSDAAPDAVKVALDEAEHHGIRSRAAALVAALGSSNQVAKLRDVLGLPSSADPWDEVRGIALRALWDRGLLTAEQLFEHLDAPRRPSLFGAYKLLVLRSDLAQQVWERCGRGGLLTALEWVRRIDVHEAGRHDGLGTLAERVLRVAAEHLDDADVARQVVSLVSRGVKTYTLSRDLLSSVTDPTEARRLLLRGLLAASEDEPLQPHHLLLSGLVRVEDEAWLRGLPPRDAIHASAVALLPHVVAMGSSEPPVAALEAPNDGSLIDASTAPARARTREQRIASVLKMGETDPVRAWLVVPSTLAADPETGEERDWWGTGLDRQPAWLQASSDTRSRLLDTAVAYLDRFVPPPGVPGLSLKWPLAAGLHALRVIARVRPDRLQELPSRVWADWAATVIAWPSMLDDVAQSVVGERLVAHARPALVESLRVLLAHKDDDGRFLNPVLQAADSWWCAEAGSELVTALEEPGAHPKRVGALLAVLLRHGLARDRAVDMLSSHVDLPRRVAAAAALTRVDAAGAWEVVGAALESDQRLGAALARSLAEDTGAGRSALDRVPAGALASMFLASVELTGGEHAERESRRSGWGVPDDLVRSDLVQALQRRGTRAAAAALGRLRDALPSGLSRDPAPMAPGSGSSMRSDPPSRSTLADWASWWPGVWA